MLSICEIMLIALNVSAVNVISIEPETSVLIHTYESEPLVLISSSVDAVYDHRKIGIRIQYEDHADDKELKVSFEIEGDNKIHSITAPIVGEPDISTAKYFISDEGDLTLEMRYAEGNDCFINDEGRSRLVIVLQKSRRIIAYTISYEGCEPSVSEISG